MPGMVRLRSCPFSSYALVGKLAEGYVTAVAITGVGCPPAENPFATICFADVLFPVTGVCNEVDSLDLCQRDTPVGVPGIVHQVLQLVVGEQYAIEPGEGNFIPVGDLQHRHARACRRAGVPVPAPGVIPFDYEPVIEGCKEVCRAQVEASVLLDGRRCHLTAVLVGTPKTGATPTIGNENDPVSGRICGEAGRNVLFPGVGENSLRGQILRPTQRMWVTRLKGVADDVYVLQRNRWDVIRTYSPKYMTQGKRRAGRRLFRDHCLRRRIAGGGISDRTLEHLMPLTHGGG